MGMDGPNLWARNSGGMYRFDGMVCARLCPPYEMTAQSSSVTQLIVCLAPTGVEVTAH